MVSFTQRQNGSNNNRVARVYTNRVNVLHTANGDGIIGGVAHNLKFNFFVALHALLNEYLMNGRELECVCAYLNKLCLIVGKATACAAKRKCRAQNNGIADALCCLFGFLERVGDLGGNGGLTNRLAKLLEELAILGARNALTACAKQFYITFAQYTLLFQLHSKVEACLPTNAGNNGIGALVAQDLGYVFQRQGLHIDLVRNGGVGHDGGRVGVDENDLVALLLECKTRLRACIVKLGGLSDNDRARTDDQNLFQICSLCHTLIPPFYSCYIRRDRPKRSVNFLHIPLALQTVLRDRGLQNHRD